MAYSDVILADTPLLYWKLEETSGTFVESGSHAGSPTNGTALTRNVNGIPAGGKAVQFNNSTTGQSKVGKAVAASYLNASYSTEVWLKTTKLDATIWMYFASPWAYLNTNGSGKVSYNHIDGTPLVGTTTVTDGNWHHIVTTFDGTSKQAKIYVDGNLEATGNRPSTQLTTNANFGLSEERSNSFAMNGTMDEFAFYPKVLTSTDVSEHYTAGLTATVDLSVATATVSVTGNEGVYEGHGKVVAITADTSLAGGASATAQTIGISYTNDGRFQFPKSAIADGQVVTISKAVLRTRVNSIGGSGTAYITAVGSGVAARTFNSSNTATGDWIEWDIKNIISSTSGSTVTVDLSANSSSTNTLSLNSIDSVIPEHRPHVEVWFETVPVPVTVDVTTATSSTSSQDVVIEAVRNTEILLDTVTSSLTSYDVSVNLGAGGNFDTANITAAANDVTVETVVSPDVTLDVSTASTWSQAHEVTVAMNATVDLSETDDVLLEAEEPVVETTAGALVDLDTPKVLTTLVPLLDVNGEPIVAREEEDPYFVSTMRTLSGIRKGVSGGTVAESFDSPLPDRFAVWLRLDERQGLVAADRAEDLLPNVYGQFNNVTIGLNNGPSGRHNVSFNGDAFISIPTQDVYYPPTNIEFTFRTSKGTQYLMGGTGTHYAQRGNSGSNSWELWLQDGKLQYRTLYISADGTQRRAVEFTGFTNLSDGDWHHVVLQYSHYGAASPIVVGAFQSEIWVDGFMEVRRRAGAGPAGFPDYIGGRSISYYGPNPAGHFYGDVPRSQWFVGDMTEMVFRNGRTLSEEEITTQRDNVMGILPVYADSARVQTQAHDVLVKGNMPRVLILDFGALTDQKARQSKFPYTNQATVTDNNMMFGRAGNLMPGYTGYVSMDHVGWGETENALNQSYIARGFQAFRKSVWKDDRNVPYRDEVTDNNRLIDLTKDINMEDYDVISIIGYPRNEAYWTLYDILDSENAYPMVPMRKQVEGLLGQIKTQVISKRKGLFINDPHSAIALGIVGRVEVVPKFKEIAFLDARVGAVTGQIDWHSAAIDPFYGANPETPLHLRNNFNDGNTFSSNRLLAARYEDTHANIWQVVRNPIDGLTTISSWIKTDEIVWNNLNPMGNPPYHVSRAYEQRAFGLEVGDRFIMDGGIVDDSAWTSTNSPNGQLAGYGEWVATPINQIKAGKAVTSFAGSFSHTPMNPVNDYDRELGNPYYDYAVSIAVEPGDVWDGQIVSGKVYVNFTEAQTWWADQQKYDKIMLWRSRHPNLPDSQVLEYMDELTFSDGTSWRINEFHMKYQFSTHYGSAQGSEVQLPQTGGSGADWGWSPGGRRGSSGVGGVGAGHAMQYNWRPVVKMEDIYTPSMANRAVIWLVADADISGNANVAVATVKTNVAAHDVTVEASKNVEVELATARLTSEAFNDLDTPASDVSVLVGTAATTMKVVGLVEEIVLDTPTTVLNAQDPEPQVIVIDWSEAVVLKMPRQIETLILEDM